MAKQRKRIEYYNLREEAVAGKFQRMIGRRDEVERLNRIIGKKIHNNALIVGANGIGKTALVYGWIKKLSLQEKYDSYGFIQFDAEHLHGLEAGEDTSQDALEQLPACILFIDNFGRAVHTNTGLMQQMLRVYKEALREPDVRVVLTLEPHEYAWLEREQPAFLQLFETLHLKAPSIAEQILILQEALPHVNQEHHVMVPTLMLEEIVAYTERFPLLGQAPQSGINVLDESISYAGAKGKRMLDSEIIAHVIGGKTGIPKSHLNADEMQMLSTLSERITAQIINQEPVIEKIATTLQRAKLGLRNPNKPLGSFLMLGPSGVGKTETAKLIAETLFGRSESFVRFDMSEFQQEHSIQRLIGAPAGYVGYEEGGALTNALRREPHCLILLDEIEKAHPKVFDIFLQVLDDGRLTSGQNETVDARNAIIMATSNIGVQKILEGHTKGVEVQDEKFISQEIVPELAEAFRLEFINRFDSILVFNPLTIAALVKIALLEVQKIEKRLAKHKVRFEIDEAVIEERIKNTIDPRFGARPVKRFIEETCESLLADSLLAKKSK
jgi:ATP-dependent Clp protease ATP-binding subunit ClpA